METSSKPNSDSQKDLQLQLIPAAGPYTQPSFKSLSLILHVANTCSASATTLPIKANGVKVLKSL